MPSNCDFQPILNDIYEAIGQIGGAPDVDLSGIESQLSDLSGRINALEGRSSGFASQIAALLVGMTTVQGVANQALNLSQRVPLQLAEVQRQTSQLSGQLGQIRATADRAREVALSTRNTTIPDLRRQLEVQNRSLAGRIAQNAGRLAGLLGRIAGIAAVVAGLAGAINSIRNSIDISALRRDMQQSQANDRQHARDIAGLNKRVDSINDKIAQVQRALEKQISALGAQFAKAMQGVRDLIGQVDRSLNARIAAVVASLLAMIAGLRGSTPGANTGGDIRNLRNRVENLSTQVNQNSTQINQTSGNVRNLRNRVENLSTQVNQNSTRINQNSGDIRNLRNRLIQLGATIAGLGTLIAGLRGSINQLRNRRMSCNWSPNQVREVVRDTRRSVALSTMINAFLTEKLFKAVTDIATNVTDLAKASGKFFKSSVLERAWNALTLLVVLHNAAMLSRNIVETLGDTLSTGLELVGIKDEENERIDINQILGKRADDFMKSLLGADVWANTKQSWVLANRALQAATNITSTLASIMDSSLEVGLWTAEQVAKIGNGLKADGVVERFRWPDMPETVPRGYSLLNKLEDLDDAASSVNMVVSELKSVKDEAQELADQREEFKKTVSDAQKGFDQLREAVDGDSDPGDITPII